MIGKTGGKKPFLMNPKVDIFDKILIHFFMKSVRTLRLSSLLGF
jgi:hypothetical protein